MKAQDLLTNDARRGSAVALAVKKEQPNARTHLDVNIARNLLLWPSVIVSAAVIYLSISAF